MSTAAIESIRKVNVRYAGASAFVASPAGSRLLLALDGRRGTVGVRGRVQSPALLRDALLTAVTVLGSDLRYKGRDRTAYLAYLAKQGKKATAAIWEAQKAFLEEALTDDTQKTAVLDPVFTVHPDEVSLEVFSRDESAYARLSFANDLFGDRKAAHGTTFLDVSPRLVEDLDRMRTYTPVDLDAGVSAPTAKLPGETRALDVPYAWLRGFLQVQTAATLPGVSCDLAP